MEQELLILPERQYFSSLGSISNVSSQTYTLPDTIANHYIEICASVISIVYSFLSETDGRMITLPLTAWLNGDTDEDYQVEYENLVAMVYSKHDQSDYD